MEKYIEALEGITESEWKTLKEAVNAEFDCIVQHGKEERRIEDVNGIKMRIRFYEECDQETSKFSRTIKELYNVRTALERRYEQRKKGDQEET